MCHCDSCGKPVPDDYQINEKEWQGDEFTGCFIWFIVGYKCPECGHFEGI